MNVVVEFGEFGVVDERAFKEPVLEGAPRLDGHMLEPSVRQCAAVMVDAGGIVHIDVEFLTDHVRVAQAELQLVHVQLLADSALQQLDLHRVDVADAEITHLALLLQDMLLGEVVTLSTDDADLGLQVYGATADAQIVQRLVECERALSVAVYVGCIEEIDALVDDRADDS